MTTIKSFAPIASAVAAMALVTGCSTMADLPTERLGSATLMHSNGTPAGTLQLFANGDSLSVAVAVTGIPQGEHGFHLHTTGECTRPDFSSAGGHLNPLNKAHGSLDPQGKHLGDLPNLSVGSSGSVTATFELEGNPDQVEQWLFDSDGTAVVIHAGADDYMSDPSGDAGSRIACGVLMRS